MFLVGVLTVHSVLVSLKNKKKTELLHVKSHSSPYFSHNVDEKNLRDIHLALQYTQFQTLALDSTDALPVPDVYLKVIRKGVKNLNLFTCHKHILLSNY